MDALYNKYKQGQVQYMPANWQHLSGVHFLGRKGDICFFETKRLVVDKDEIPDAIRYVHIKDLAFDREMEEASKRIKKRSCANSSKS